MKVIILAGGSGTRLWPLSRDKYPKQFIKLRDDKTSLFQDTFTRSLLLSGINDIYIVTNHYYKYIIEGQISELGYQYDSRNILVEPEPKNTLPAIYAGVHEINRKGHDTVVIFPSDHMIVHSDALIKSILASKELSEDMLITFGIHPDEPNTGYGYISPGSQVKNGFIVKEFKEKPDYDTALEYINKGYLWNSGIFMFNTKLFSYEVKSYAKDIYDAFDGSNSIEDAFIKIDKGISIDYGIMEKSSKIAVVSVNNIGWNDLGSFDAFYKLFQNEGDNISNKDNIMINSANNMIYTETDKLVATVDVNDLIVVDNNDALLICKKSQSQKVKDVINILKERNDTRLHTSTHEYRRWGHYRMIESRPSYKINKIKIYPGEMISYHYHNERSEHWTVIKGTATVTINDNIKELEAGESISIHSGQKHKVENNSDTALEVIEVQVGKIISDDILLIN